MVPNLATLSASVCFFGRESMHRCDLKPDQLSSCEAYNIIEHHRSLWFVTFLKTEATLLHRPSIPRSKKQTNLALEFSVVLHNRKSKEPSIEHITLQIVSYSGNK